MEFNFSIGTDSLNMPSIVMNYLDNNQSISKEIDISSALDVFPIVPIEIILEYKTNLLTKIVNLMESPENNMYLLQYTSKINEVNIFLTLQEGS